MFLLLCLLTLTAGLMTVSGRPVAAFDPEGLVFAAGIDSQHIKLYDLRSYDKGPFSTFGSVNRQHASSGDWQVSCMCTCPCES